LHNHTSESAYKIRIVTVYDGDYSGAIVHQALWAGYSYFCNWISFSFCSHGL